MLCDKCSNKSICKYYDFLVNAPMIIHIESCEKANIKSVQPINQNPNDNVALLKFKEPIDYSKIEGINLEQEETYEEEEERILVNLSECGEIESSSFSDILIGGNDDKE